MNKHLLTIVVILLSGCAADHPESAKPNDPNDPAGINKKPKIALVMKSLANEFFSTMANGAQEYQAANPDQFDLIVNGIKDERDLGRQVALVEEMMASGVDAIVIAPADSKALVSVLRRARESGIVVVNIDNRLDADVLKSQGVSIPFVGPDNKEGAKKVGKFLATRLKAGDEVCILEGVRTSFNGQQRFAGFEEATNEAGLKVVDHQSADWELSQANAIAASMLREHPQTKAILAANDSMALGAVAAVKAAGRTGEVLVVGFDNISAVQQAIRDGKVLATVDQHGDQLAVYGIQNALKLLSEPNAKVEDVETPVDLITRESLTR